MVQLLTRESTTEATPPGGDHEGLQGDWGSKEAWVSRLALVALVALVDSAEIVVMDSDLQNAAGKQEIFMPFSIVT